jgi:GNAT superfamily N-acetyltransferase
MSGTASTTPATGAGASPSLSTAAEPSPKKVPALSKSAAKKAAKARLEEQERARQEKRKKALLSPDGTPRDVLQSLQAFAKFDRAGMDLEVVFRAPGTPAFTPALSAFLFDLTKANMEALYNAAAGWGWKDSKKRGEILDADARYLVARERGGAGEGEGEGGAPVAFLAFRFLMEGPYDVLYVYELQLSPSAQRKGLGKHLMQMAEMVARQNGMQM